MPDFIDNPQKAQPAILTIYDPNLEVFRAADIGDFGAGNTGHYDGVTFSSLPSPQKASPAVMYLYDSDSGVFRTAKDTDFNSAKNSASRGVSS